MSATPVVIVSPEFFEKNFRKASKVASLIDGEMLVIGPNELVMPSYRVNKTSLVVTNVIYVYERQDGNGVVQGEGIAIPLIRTFPREKILTVGIAANLDNTGASLFLRVTVSEGGRANNYDFPCPDAHLAALLGSGISHNLSR